MHGKMTVLQNYRKRLNRMAGMMCALSLLCGLAPLLPCPLMLLQNGAHVRKEGLHVFN